MKKPSPYPIINPSGIRLRIPGGLPVLKDGRFQVLDAAVAGDAPKDFLRIYRYGEGRKANPKTWPAWIAKVGHKYYPNESITEHLLTRIGQAMGLNMADSRLMWFGPQLRFMSRYFLKPDRQSLVHGAEIFAGYLEDRDFVEEVEKADQSRHLFTFQFVEHALKNEFPHYWEALLVEFTRLLAFDAIVGNNDRHFYNWGVVLDIEGRCVPQFSPIYDSARALYWNTTDARLEELSRDRNRRAAHQKKYITKCYPKTGWDGMPMPNHFDLMRQIAANRPALGQLLREMPIDGLAHRVSSVLQDEFVGLISPLRADFIQSCLDRRATLFHEAVTNP